MIVVVNDEDIVRIFSSIQWTISEVKAFRDYCLIERLNDTSELAYIIMAMIDCTYGGSIVEYAYGVQSNTRIEFNDQPLVNLSQNFFDEIVYMIEDNMRLNREVRIHCVSEDETQAFVDEFESSDIEEFYDRCAELYLKIIQVFLSSLVYQEKTFSLIHHRGGLVCMG